MTSRWVDTAAAAHGARIHPTTLRRKAQRGEITPRQEGRRLRWDVRDLAKVERKQPKP